MYRYWAATVCAELAGVGQGEGGQAEVSLAELGWAELSLAELGWAELSKLLTSACRVQLELRDRLNLAERLLRIRLWLSSYQNPAAELPSDNVRSRL